jgi:hypothetical protein
MAARGSLLGSVFLALGLFVIVFALVGYGMGWLHFQRTEQKATIEIETQQIEQAAEDAVDKSKDLVREAGEELQELGSDTTTETRDEVPQHTEQVVE